MTYTEYLQKTTAFKNFVSESETKPELLETLAKLTSLLEETVTEQEEQMTSMDDTERQESIRNMKVAELKTLCKTNGWTGYSKLKKDDLITFVLRNYGQEGDDQDDDQEVGEYDSMTVAELKKVCKDNNISGYSKLKKDELLELVNTTMVERGEESDDANSDDEVGDYDSMTVTELKTLCRDNGISGYSKLKKDDLLELVKTALSTDNDSDNDSDDDSDDDSDNDSDDDDINNEEIDESDDDDE